MNEMTIQYGYGGYAPSKPLRPKTSALANAASPAATDPFGFQTARNTTSYGNAPPAAAPIPARPVSAATSPLTAAATKPAVNVNPTTLTPAAPPTPGGYDINTDPSLQSTYAFTGLGDEEAQSAALKAKQHLLLGYGDPTLAAAALGSNDPTAQAAGQNPTSTLSQLGQQRDRNLHDLTDQLFASNLGYSGYRINQEQQAATDYQNQLANAAASVNGGLDTISGNLSSTLAGNQQQRLAAEQAARNNAVQLAIAAGTAGGTKSATGGGPAAPTDPSLGGPGPYISGPSGIHDPYLGPEGNGSGQGNPAGIPTAPGNFFTGGAGKITNDQIASLLSATPADTAGAFDLPGSLAQAASYGNAKQRKRQLA